MRYSIMRNYLVILLLGTFSLCFGQSKSSMLASINDIRTSGCSCGDKKMKPVAPLQWHESLEHSASNYASYLRANERFSHYSENGHNIGDRVDAVGYNWQVVGENIAEGQVNFEQAMEDWMKSPSHCEMIMNGNVTEMGLARSGHYWVQHFASPMKKQNVKNDIKSKN